VKDFANSGSMISYGLMSTNFRPYSMTNLGLSINLHLWPVRTKSEFLVAALLCWVYNADNRRYRKRVRIYLRRALQLAGDGSVRPIYRRVQCHEFELVDQRDSLGSREDIFVLEDEQLEHMSWINQSMLSTWSST
jgi:hypothetical protein